MTTQLEVSALPASRELDAWVAMKVFGVDAGDIFYDDTQQEIVSRIPPYSTSIAAAWEIVEKLDDCLHLRQHGKSGVWEAYFCHKQCEADYRGEADTAPLAICRAALKAVGD